MTVKRVVLLVASSAALAGRVVGSSRALPCAFAFPAQTPRLRIVDNFAQRTSASKRRRVDSRNGSFCESRTVTKRRASLYAPNRTRRTARRRAGCGRGTAARPSSIGRARPAWRAEEQPHAQIGDQPEGEGAGARRRGDASAAVAPAQQSAPDEGAGEEPQIHRAHCSGVVRREDAFDAVLSPG